MISLGVLLFELTLTRIFSIVLWYDYAFMAISVAFFGLGIGALTVHILKNKIIRANKESIPITSLLPSKILQSTIAFGISLPVFLFAIGHIIPPSTSFLYLFYLASSIPFFFAGMSMAMTYLTMPKEISKLYFADLAGAAAATLILDPLMRVLGAESVVISIGLIVIGPSLLVALIIIRLHTKRSNDNDTSNNQLSRSHSHLFLTEGKVILYGLIVLVAFTVLLSANLQVPAVFSIPPGENKGLHYELTNSSLYDHVTHWNSFSRIDVDRHNEDVNGSSRLLARIIIDGDAGTPVFRWNGSSVHDLWLKQYMDFMPYEILKPNSMLVIGGGGGEDVLTALVGGSRNVTVVELNPLIVSMAKQFGGELGGNLYNRSDVKVFIDDGRRFISSTDSKYDMIVIKLVDSWAAQLAGGYALSENYLYTVEAFKQYLHHLNGPNGILIMVRWNFELPRLIPLVAESLRQENQEAGKSIGDISAHVVILEDRPGLYFGSNPQRSVFPVLVMIKNSHFTNSELNLIKKRVDKSNAKVIALPHGYIQPPYGAFLFSNGSESNDSYQSQTSSDPQKGPRVSMLKPPTDDSPFYFAREGIPKQMIILLETVLAVSATLAVLLIYYSRVNKIRLAGSSIFHILFVIFIGLGFIFLEITFIQKFLLLLGTPIMALTVILFSVLLSSGVGAYLSGRIFPRNPYKLIITSIPVLATIVLAYYTFLPAVLDSAITLPLSYRITLTFVLLSAAGLLMGFQFPSIAKITSSTSSSSLIDNSLEVTSCTDSNDSSNHDITLLWGINIIASVIGSVLTAISSMAIGFSGNLMVGFGLYLGGLAFIIVAAKITPITERL
jgi:hypothetical protein